MIVEFFVSTVVSCVGAEVIEALSPEKLEKIKKWCDDTKKSGHKIKNDLIETVSVEVTEALSPKKLEKIKKWCDDTKKSGHKIKNDLIETASVENWKKLKKWYEKSSQKDTTSVRSRQLDNVLSESEKAIRAQEEKELNSNIKITGLSLALATGGALFYSPLGLLSVPPCLYSSIYIFQKTWVSLKKGKIGTEFLITLLVIGGIIYGYFFALSLAAFLFSLSFKWLTKLTRDAKHQLVDMFNEQPSHTWIVVDNIEISVATENLEIGQIVVVSGGEIIPVDGQIKKGVATLNEQHLTGEACSQERVPGDYVFASTVVLSGKIYIEVQKTGSNTSIAKIGNVLNNTIDFKANAQLRAEHLSDSTVIPILATSIVALPFVGAPGSLAVINSHFKDRMTIIAPISIMTFLNIASENGILIKDGRSLDLLNSVDTVVFDKTGTLTEDQPQVSNIYACDKYETSDVLQWAAASEQKQEHPIAKAILQKAQGLKIPEIDETEYKIGYGLSVRCGNKWIRTGSSRFLELEGIAIPSFLKEKAEHSRNQGCSVVFIALDDLVIGVIELTLPIRLETQKVIQQLRENASIKEIYIISGDHETTTRKLAEYLQVDHYFAETLPEQKAEIIEQLQKQGKSICYVGDGVNDSIALKKSQVSISLNNASTIAVDTAQIVLMDESLNQLPKIFEIAQDFHHNTSATFAAVLLPSLVGIGGIFFLHFGILHTVILNLTGLAVGIANSSLPLLMQKINSDNDDSISSDNDNSIAEKKMTKEIA
ncbi:heavy metal translocating P-type ATPase [Candidatus Uabimicrobium sp. HlEnr_7]|uniref:heavy metal translocating P-type ATPase n=1 Tax=Candidatus Uabimicrobium helgolandensis TaxID=3095367 RepID=UPI0035593113